MRSVRFVAAVAVSIGAAAQVTALYVTFEAKMVPVERLVKNLERAISADPRNIELRINLARLHGMAYALKSEEVPAAAWRQAGVEPYYGHAPNLIPYQNTLAPTTAAERAAQAHLKQALAQYEAALKLDPLNLLARLGYGWMLDQAAEKVRAIAEYRRVIKEAWVVEESQTRGLPAQRFYTHEAASYLIALLDPTRDAAEIADLRAKQKAIDDKPARAITPLAIPLEDGVPPDAIPAMTARVRFDADGSGHLRRWTWISPDAGWLVHDPLKRDEITSALQWFGNVTFWLFWNNGYHALSALDDDGNGELAAGELRDLAIWHDRNSNGISDAGEVRPLAAHDIVGLSCRYVDGDGLGRYRLQFAAVSPQGVRLADGRIRPSYDVLLWRADALTLERSRAVTVVSP